MARLIPGSALEDPKATDGEKRLIRTLMQTLDDTYYVWYQPKLAQSRRPDVLVYLPAVGLVIYEVKDWTIAQIRAANPDTWEVEFGTVAKNETNPFKRARDYFYEFSRALSGEPLLLSADETRKGKRN